jgi:hypothetical protein
MGNFTPFDTRLAGQAEKSGSIATFPGRGAARSAAPQSRDRSTRRNLERSRVCNAPLRKSYVLRCARDK